MTKVKEALANYLKIKSDYELSLAVLKQVKDVAMSFITDEKNYNEFSEMLEDVVTTEFQKKAVNMKDLITNELLEYYNENTDKKEKENKS